MVRQCADCQLEQRHGRQRQPIKWESPNDRQDKSNLARLVDQFNQTLAGTKTSRGQSIPVLKLPTNYEFGKNFQTQDLRVSRTFVYRERYKLTVMGEIFNMLNIANLGGYSGNVRDTANFGQPQNRADRIGRTKVFPIGCADCF